MKYYYTCPIEAAFMEQKYSMKLIQERYGQATNQPQNMATPVFKKIRGYGMRGYRWAIHHESLHVLEPQVGDIGVDSLNSPGEYRDGAFRTDDGADLGDCRIVHRNGKAFFWPEVEQ